MLVSTRRAALRLPAVARCPSRPLPSRTPLLLPRPARRHLSTLTMATPTASPASTALVAPLPATYAPHVAAAIDAVRLASILTARVQAQLKSGDAVSKEDASPVTVADYGAQALVAWSLAQAGGPPIPLVAEEDAADLRAEGGAAMSERITALVNEVLASSSPSTPPLTPAAILDLIDTGASPGGADGMYWVLDPIDGTRGFVGGRQYAICLGLLDAGALAAGVLGCPNLPATPLTAADGGRVVDDESFGERDGVLFYASVGGGAWCAPLAGPDAHSTPPTRIHATPGDAPPPTLRFMESFESAHSDFGVAARAASALGVTAPPPPPRLAGQVWRPGARGCCDQHEVPEAGVS